MFDVNSASPLAVDSVRSQAPLREHGEFWETPKLACPIYVMVNYQVKDMVHRTLTRIANHRVDDLFILEKPHATYFNGRCSRKSRHHVCVPLPMAETVRSTTSHRPTSVDY